MAGLAVLLGGLTAGLAIWALILFPNKTPPRLGGGRQVASRAALPEGHPPLVERPSLPGEAKRLLRELATRAERAPREVAPWLSLAEARYRAARIDPSYYPQALAAYEHVLELDPRNPQALRGAGNVHFDRDEPAAAIGFYQRYLKIRPGDPGARTDLGTMYLYSGDTVRAVRAFQEVLAANPRFFQAQVNLAIAYHRQGKRAKVAEALRAARSLAPNDDVRAQIDQMLGALRAGDERRGKAAAAGSTGSGPAFHSAVEQAFRSHPIMGPRVVRFEWSAPGAGRVLLQDFPMEAMPEAVREKLVARLGEEIRRAKAATGLSGKVRVELADAASGKLMTAVGE